jgi:signal transduction histidine kinase/CheY-like chemotaxis protein
LLGRFFKRFQLSVHDRLLLGGVIVLAPISLAFGFWGVESQREVLLDTIDRQGRSLVGATAIFCVEPLLAQDYPVLDTYVDSLTIGKDAVVYARVEDRRGRVVAEAKVADFELAHTTEYQSWVSVPGDGPRLPTEKVGRVVLGLSTEPAEAALADSRSMQFIETLAGFLALVIGLSRLHSRLVGRPLMVLDRDAQRLAQADLSEPIELSSNDEFGRLASALDEMRVGLRDSYQEIQDQNESLLELDRLKSEFLATVSHEIRTPMTGVIGFAHELLETDLNDEQREMMNLVSDSADNLLFILNHILDFSKLDAGKLDLEVVPFDLGSLVGDVVKLSAPAAKAGDVRLSLCGNESLPPVLMGDPHRIRQVVNNLIANALKFSQGDSVEVRVESRNQTAGTCWVKVLVRDTGMGIPADRLELLFEPFRQVDGSHSRRFGGSGLGLSICQGLLGLMGSRVEVSSELGQGSDFWFELELPVAESALPVISGEAQSKGMRSLAAPGATVPGLPGTTAVHSSAQDQPCKGIRVLLAEDNLTNQKLIRSLLTRLGADVTVANHGRSAIDQYFSNVMRYDVILMDCQMPGCDGFEATEEIRRRTQGSRQIPILALTANAEPTARARCIAAGMDDFLSKPIDLKELRDSLLRWTGQQV